MQLDETSIRHYSVQRGGSREAALRHLHTHVTMWQRAHGPEHAQYTHHPHPLSGTVATRLVNYHNLMLQHGYHQQS